MEKENMGISVLSLFDGMGCGRIALERSGIDVDEYYACEIEKSAIAVATARYPGTIQLGDVSKVSYRNGTIFSENGAFKSGRIDLLIGGSPCTNFSSIGNQRGMSSGAGRIEDLATYLSMKSSGEAFEGQSYLFWEYVRILRETAPEYFLLENVVMAKRWSNVITKSLGVKPVEINSSLLSAQNRPRLYWTNIPGVTVPCDRGISLDDILIESADKSDVSSCKTVQKSIPRLIKKYGYIPERFNPYNAAEITNKACALSRGSMVTSSCATLLFVKTDQGVHSVSGGLLDGSHRTSLEDGRYNLRRLSLEEMEALQTVPTGYTNVHGVSRQKRSAMLGNGWTVDVISHIFSFLPRAKGKDSGKNQV